MCEKYINRMRLKKQENAWVLDNAKMDFSAPLEKGDLCLK
ncbi:hypothetical protein HMPREF0454_00608 [Hafnia alvei ATCC 51873]|uniref:Uncharacterized protein n=1 Tax=Hafnia alvei ATCC 51873 TaxID=1002364 RepID=G9Y1Z6_HAFAL|nr:hypothetical protein HMPREF0454_00608 [Hafnia alvei ATCC 51873]